MADVKWIKLATNIFDNRKIRQIESLPDGDAIIVIWMKLLCLAGNINDSGYVYFTKELPYTDQMLSTQFNRPIATIQLAIKTFEQFGMVEVIDNILHISNWEKYQNVEGMEKIREQNRARVAKHRQKQKLLESNVTSNVTVTQCNATDKEDKDKKKNKKREEKTYSADAKLNEAILAFIEYRQKIKKPMTDRAIDLLIKKLNEMDPFIPNQIEILNQSIVNGWNGIFPLKQENKSKDTSYPKQTKAEELNDFYNMAADWAEGGE